MPSTNSCHSNFQVPTQVRNQVPAKATRQTNEPVQPQFLNNKFVLRAGSQGMQNARSSQSIRVSQENFNSTNYTGSSTSNHAPLIISKSSSSFNLSNLQKS